MSRRWAQLWREVLDAPRADQRARVARGVGYHRSGRVVDVRVEHGRLAGRVQGSRATPYAVRIEVPLLPDEQWERVVAAIAGQARHSARLVAGLAPEGVERELAAAGVNLFPSGSRLLHHCECPDELDPCAHAAALWEAAAERLVDEPALLLRFRGRGHQQLLADVASARQSAHARAPRAATAVTELSADGWWNEAQSLEEVEIPSGAAPPTPAPALRVAGDPPGWAGGVGVWDLLRGPIERAGRWAELLADERYLGGPTS
jgi:uncharacterized Zn finger protein